MFFQFIPMSSGSLSLRTRGLDRALLTAVLTLALSELLQYLKNKYKKTDEALLGDDISGEKAGARRLPQLPVTHSGDPERGRRWYTYQTW